jgi:hypothetical protein
MKGTTPLVIHYSLLIVAALGAYWVYSAPDETAPEQETPIWDISLSDIDRITFSEDAKIVEMTPNKGKRVTISIDKRDEKIPDPEKWDEEEDEETDKKKSESGDDIERSVYPAEENLTKKLEARFPLLAKRQIGAVRGDALARFGFDKPQGVLRITAKGRTAVFEVGAGSYGGQTTYLRERPDGEVFLIDANLIRLLDIAPPRHMDRKLLGVDKNDISAVTVEEGDKSRRMVKVGMGPKAKWAPATSQDTPNDMMTNWVSAFFRMSTKQYLLENDMPKMTPIARIGIEVEGKQVDTLALAQTNDKEGKKQYFAKSTHTGSWVEVSRFAAESVVSDLPSILEGE